MTHRLKLNRTLQHLDAVYATWTTFLEGKSYRFSIGSDQSKYRLQIAGEGYAAGPDLVRLLRKIESIIKVRVFPVFETFLSSSHAG